MKRYSIAISPCPNDTFVFYALINHKIPMHGIELDFHFFDIEELNLGAINHQFDICKISYALVPQVSGKYNLLTSGGALGRGCGPLLITHHPQPFQLNPEHRVVLPGQHTTASFLFNHFFPNHQQVSHQLFSSIEDQLQQHHFDAGVIIHESRFTYQQKGLNKLVDLGAAWEERYHLPIPLGGIVIAKSINATTQKQINQLIIESIDYAWDHMEEVLEFCKCHAQEMDREVMTAHIRLYVNEYTKSLNHDGKKAIEKLFATKENENSCIFVPTIQFID
jgi:1,4-dihydroxy-6-naphthoate synthase